MGEPCHDPRVAVAVLHEMTIQHQLVGRLFILHPPDPLRRGRIAID
jgi:hypothetical protein